MHITVVIFPLTLVCPPPCVVCVVDGLFAVYEASTLELWSFMLHTAVEGRSLVLPFIFYFFLVVFIVIILQVCACFSVLAKEWKSGVPPFCSMAQFKCLQQVIMINDEALRLNIRTLSCSLHVLSHSVIYF